MTVEALIRELKRMPQDSEVFMLTDISNDNWDDDACRYCNVYAVETVNSETVYNDTGFGDDEVNVILSIGC
jgi:hypothetical protein